MDTQWVVIGVPVMVLETAAGCAARQTARDRQAYFAANIQVFTIVDYSSPLW